MFLKCNIYFSFSYIYYYLLKLLIFLKIKLNNINEKNKEYNSIKKNEICNLKYLMKLFF